MTETRQSGELLPVSEVEPAAAERIFTVRSQRVVLDADLAEFYGVETKALNRQVTRNLDRFPEDFSFQLSDGEAANLRRQNGTASWGGRRNNPRVFTEHGALALSGVLKSERSAQVSVAIARAFVAMRQQLAEIDAHPVIGQIIERLHRLEGGSERQTEFNEQVLDTLGELHPLLEAVSEQLRRTG